MRRVSGPKYHADKVAVRRTDSTTERNTTKERLQVMIRTRGHMNYSIRTAFRRDFESGPANCLHFPN